MDINYYKQYEPIFGSWHITRQIGEGSFGKVFEIQREDFGTTYRAALKAITVPASETELRDVMADGMDEEGARAYYSTFVQDLVKEFALMSRLKGNSNIVSYENHQVIEHKEGIGWDILIQMELLTPLNEYTRKNTITRQDVIQLGIDMCRALELCQKYNIIHRDVKPENMFISENGDFKLGDFGIARTVEKTTSGLSKKGTYTYMAPEVYKGEPYNSTVDIYSLGIVLYRLLNENRTPFLPAYPAPITHSDRENALARRFSGAPLPRPSHAEGRLAEIVLRACAYDPKERYSVPLRMREDLEAILYNREEAGYIYPEGDEAPQKSVQYVKTGDEPPAAPLDAAQKNERTVSDMGGWAPVGGQTDVRSRAEAEPEETVGGFGGTVSDFGRPFTTSQEDFGGEKTQSDFGPVSGSAAAGAARRTGRTTGAERKSTGAGKGRKKLIAGLAAGCLVLIACVAGFLLLRQRSAEQAMAQMQAVQDEAYRLYQERQFSECADYASAQLAETYPDNEALMAILASAQFELGGYEEAAEIYRQLSEMEDYEMQVENLRDYAVCLARLGRLDEAATVFVMLTEQGASADVTSYVLGETYYAKQDYENAASEFQNVLSVTEDEVLQRRCYNSLAETYRESGDYQASIDLIEGAVEKPEMAMDPVLYEMLGLAYYQSYQELQDESSAAAAADAFCQAIQLGVQKEYMYVNAAFCYYYSASLDQAYEMLDSMQQIYPDSYKPYAIRAIFYISEENEKDESVRDYSAAQEEYESAKNMAVSSDDQTYLQMLESYIQELEEKGWL